MPDTFLLSFTVAPTKQGKGKENVFFQSDAETTAGSADEYVFA